MTYLQDSNWWIKHAQDVIYNTYGDTVSVDAKKKDLFKFGRTTCTTAATEYTVMTLDTVASETYVSTNIIDSISCANNSATNSMVVEGHTISGSNLTFVSQTVALTGQTEKALTTPLCRVTRAYNNDTTALGGAVYIYDNTGVTLASGVPDIKAQIHLIIANGDEQSFKCATAISSVDYFIITRLIGSVRGKTAASVDFKLKVREFGKVFREQAEFTVGATGSSAIELTFEPYIIVPKNADVIITATSDTNSSVVDAAMDGVLAIVQ